MNRNWFKENKIPILVLLLCLVLGWVLYGLFGHQLIRAMYEGKSIGILNRIIEGQDVYPLEYYFARTERLYLCFSLGLFSVFLLFFLFNYTILSSSDDVAKKTSISAKRQLLYFLFFFLTTAGLALRYDILNLPLLWDNQHYFYMAERIASGVSPYTSHLEPKHALSMMLTGAAISIGRVVNIADVNAARILSLSVLATSVGLIWLLTYRLTQSLRASAFAALLMFSFSGYIYMGAMGSRPKVFMVFFMLLTMLLFCQRKLFWAGLCASLSFLCWQPSLLMLGALMLVLARSPKRLYNITLAASGAILPILLYEAYFIFTGSFWEQIEQTYYFPAKFIPHNFSGFVSSFVELNFHWKWGFGIFNILPLVFAYGLIRYWLHLFRSRRRRFFFIDLDPGWLYFHISMYGSLAFTYYDHNGYPDIFFVLPFMAIMSGWTLDRSIEDISNLKSGFRRIASRLCLFVLLALIIMGIFCHKLRPLPWSELFRREKNLFTLSDQYRIAAVVRQYLENNEDVYAIDCTHLLAFNHSDNWMIYGTFFRGFDDFIAYKTGTNLFKPVKNNTWPSIILLSRRPPRGSKSWLWLGALYTDITPPEFKHQHIQVLKLKKRD